METFFQLGEDPAVVLSHLATKNITLFTTKFLVGCIVK
jgi:hypothetical protein